MNEQKAMQAYKVLRAMESATDLMKVGFTLSDYYEAQEVLQMYAQHNGKDGALTKNEAVAKWFKKHGFNVELCGTVWLIR